eukprot:evm.model.NODE_40556_length_1069_cov_12.115996.1
MKKEEEEREELCPPCTGLASLCWAWEEEEKEEEGMREGGKKGGSSIPLLP